MTSTLAIEKVEDALIVAILRQNVILTAPPGAGKSTYLPISLLRKSLFTGLIIMLQPRQIAVRNIAQFIAKQLGERVGESVGYQMRGEAKYSHKCKLLIMTEGLLSAKIRKDPELSGVSLVIFDEFHERSLHSDISLALCLDIQAGFRTDLRLLVMSATLKLKPLQQLLPDAVNIESEGRSYSIEYHYRPLLGKKRGSKSKFQDLYQQVLTVVKEVLAMSCAPSNGHILVFLPSAKDINILANKFEQLDLPSTAVHKLYGALSAKQQQSVFDTLPQDKQKIILSTNIAETSVTIDGVSVVIDSGLEKQQSFNLNAQLNELKVTQISKSSATQRAGRAGRQQEGLCFRLWSEQHQQYLIENATPEISRVDISSNELLLQDWGSNFDSLALIDKPSQGQIIYAQNLLKALSFSKQHNAISPLGRIAIEFGCHPRLAFLLQDANHHIKHHRVESAFLIIVLVVILDNKPINQLAETIDVVAQMQWLLTAIQHTGKSHQAVSKHINDIKRWSQKLDLNQSFNSTTDMLKTLSSAIQHIHYEDIASSLLSAYYDRLGLRVDTENKGKLDAGVNYLLSNGTGVTIKRFANEYSKQEGMISKAIVCLEAQVQSGAYSVVRLYFQIEDSDFKVFCKQNLRLTLEQKWDEKLEKVIFKKVETIGAIKLNEQNIAYETAKSLLTTEPLIKEKYSLEDLHKKSEFLLISQIKQYGLKRISGKAWSFVERNNLAHQLYPNMQFPCLTEALLLATCEEWLKPFLKDKLTWHSIVDLNWQQLFETMLSWEQQTYLNKHLPTHFIAPTGVKHKLVYTVVDNENPSISLAIRLQELYGLQGTPSIANGRLKISLSLLSPAHREIQKTQDLRMFWQGSYKEVQKEMKGRYPKHFWPDDPAHAKPTLKTKHKM